MRLNAHFLFTHSTHTKFKCRNILTHHSECSNMALNSDASTLVRVDQKKEVVFVVVVV